MMSFKKLSRAQKLKINKELTQYSDQLKYYCYETIQEIKEIDNLQKHHVDCKLAFQNLEESYKTLLTNKGFDYTTTANFLMECACLYKFLEDRPKKLFRLHKQVLRAHQKLNGNPPENLMKDFQ